MSPGGDAAAMAGLDRGLDIVCGGSQKALGAPAGVGFVSVSARAWEANARATCPRFYWDFGAARRAAADGPETP